MRPIKFRAWNMVSKRMIDLKEKTPLILDMKVSGLYLPFSDGLPLMQFTGLHDKNGKEIFEGDVVRIFKDSIVTEGYITGLIEYEGNCAAFYFSHYQGWASSLSGLLEDSEDIEIIGNRFENPELLESK